MSCYNNEHSIRYYDGSENETTIKQYDLIYKKCSETKSRSCIINFYCGNRRKVYLNDDDTLTINCKWADVDGQKDWKQMYIKLNRGEWYCADCGDRYDETGTSQVRGDCKECWYKREIKYWKQKQIDYKEYNAVKLISKSFLECRYNPQYKYCRDRMNDLYDREYDEDYVEGEKIFIKNLLPTPKLNIKSIESEIKYNPTYEYECYDCGIGLNEDEMKEVYEDEETGQEYAVLCKKCY